MNDLKPCPFCGAEAFVNTGYDHVAYYWIECKGCETKTRLMTYDASPSRQEVWFKKGKNLWNTRTED